MPSKVTSPCSKMRWVVGKAPLIFTCSDALLCKKVRKALHWHSKTRRTSGIPWFFFENINCFGIANEGLPRPFRNPLESTFTIARKSALGLFISPALSPVREAKQLLFSNIRSMVGTAPLIFTHSDELLHCKGRGALCLIGNSKTSRCYSRNHESFANIRVHCEPRRMRQPVIILRHAVGWLCQLLLYCIALISFNVLKRLVGRPCVVR